MSFRHILSSVCYFNLVQFAPNFNYVTVYNSESIMATSSYNIVVWERSTKQGKWCPYSAEVCCFLENSYEKNVSEVCLGDVYEHLKIYIANLKNMTQVSEATGTVCSLRRSFYDDLSSLGRGYSWEWLDDNDNWHLYDVSIIDYIDIAFLEGKKSISLRRKFPGYNYEIVFTKMIQINKQSKRKRKIRRVQLTTAYPLLKLSDDSCTSTQESTDRVQKSLDPSYLAEEVPGTSELFNAVNKYKRNVEVPMDESCDDNSNSENVFKSHAKHLKTSGDKEKVNKDASSVSTTVALVHGRPWTDSRPPHTPHSRIKPVPGIDPLPQTGKSKINKDSEMPANIIDQYSEIIELSADIENENCIICCEVLSNDSAYKEENTLIKLKYCNHIFHRACIEAMYESGPKGMYLQCPSCKKIHGEKYGLQPPGEMIYHVIPYSLPGYPECDTIRIIYDIHSGTQGPEHPRPGKKYTARGFPRHCYLPDNEGGRKVLRLLIKAWLRKLIFTIGRSSTTGEESTVTWNEIHHKTEFGCNRRGHGFPDPNYFENVLAELEAHGIIDDEVYEWQPA